MNPKIFILGANGMLGSYVSTYFKSLGYEVVEVTRKDIDICTVTEQDLEYFFNFKCDPKTGCIVINCAGVIKPQIDKLGNLNGIVGNSVFPFLLANVCEKLNMKMFHITSDCVFTGKKGLYTEKDAHDCLDVYGKTKSLGEPENCQVIRTSIIGEEYDNQRSLVEWIKTQKNKQTNGYTNHYWNGVTCLELAKIINKFIVGGIYWNGVKHIYSPNIVTKQELVQTVSDVYGLNITINPIETPEKCDRSLSSIYDMGSKVCISTIKSQIETMKEFDVIGRKKDISKKR